MGDAMPRGDDQATDVWQGERIARPRPRPALPPGYEYVSELGRGGMGVVYLVHNTRLDRDEALKMVLAGGHAARDQLARFLAEARAAADLSHPNVARVHETGECAGLPYFTLEYCPQGSLADRVRDGGILEPAQAATILERLARAVAYAHARGIIHRDLKPENVLFDALGEPKVTDFGLARRLDAGSGLTGSAAALGTPTYMSPEQAAGRAREAGPPSDVYSLGAILYRLLVGRPPFQGISPHHTMALVQNQEPVPPRQLNPAIPRDLETIALKCLGKDPQRRYATALGLADDLRAFLDGRPIAARPIAPPERLVRWVRRRPREAALLLGLVMLGGGLVAGAFRAQAREARSRDEARRQRDQARVVEMVAALGEVESGAVGRVLHGLAEYPDRAGPLLRRALAQATGPRPEARARLGLLPTDPSQAAELARYAMAAPADELLAVRDALAGHGPAVEAALWPTLLGPRAPGRGRLHAGCVLAAFTPSTDPRWRRVASAVADSLVGSDPLESSERIEALRPVRSVLVGPLRHFLETSRRRLREDRLSVDEAELVIQGDLAASILLDYAADAPEVLAGLSLAADNAYYRKLLPLLLAHPAPVAAVMHAELARATPSDDPDAPTDPGEAREALALSQANAAVTLLQLGEPGAAWPLLRQSADPSRRSYLIRQLPGRGVVPLVLLARLATEADASARRALVLALGDYDEDLLPRPLRDAVAPGLLASYRDDPDPGLHGALDWLLRQAWRRDEALRAIDAALAPAAGATPAHDPRRGWWVNGQGQTYAVVRGPVEFTMGSEPGEPDYFNNQRPVAKRIPRDFALATKGVTVRDWGRFRAAHPAPRDEPDRPRDDPGPDDPVVAMTWYEAAAYCRWLSEQEGLPPEEMCYPEVDRCVEGMTLPEDYLSRRGYRLPTEAEWEYAARAGTTTARSYGTPLDLLDRYAWHYDNSDDRAHPVGRKRPNDLGLFDTLGNTWSWTGGDFADHRPGDDAGTTLRTIVAANGRSLRGGAYFIHASDLRSALRFNYRPGERFVTIGLRPARTCR